MRYRLWLLIALVALVGCAGIGVTQLDKYAADYSYGRIEAAKAAVVNLDRLEFKPPADEEYRRSHWRHWIRQGDGCKTTRTVVLENYNENALVEYATDKHCRVESGEWTGPWTQGIYMESSQVDIDHHVPLENAWLSGEWKWNRSKKEEYANNLRFPGHLHVMQASANRQKGAKSPDQWKPKDESLWCHYAVDWVLVKKHYDLTVTDDERAALQNMLGKC